MNLNNDMLTMRSFERIFALIVGTLSIFLGYLIIANLAKLMEMISTSEGILQIAGVEVSPAQWGPGVSFFLLIAVVFGIFIRILHKNLKGEVYKPAKSTAAKKHKPIESINSVRNIHYLSATEGIFDNDAVSTVRFRLFRDFRAIDCIQKALTEYGANASVKIPKKGKTDFYIAINNLKASAMLTVWDDDWGDYALFAKWVREGCKEPIPKDIETAAQAYLGQAA